MERSTNGVGRMLIAGILGGAAEMAWVTLYCGTAGGAEVARQVTATFASGGAGAQYAVAMGIAIHLVLSTLVALCYALLIWKPLARTLGTAAHFVLASVALAVLWALNFFIVLPWVNPAFVDLLPYSVSLASKLMFGMAMAAGLVWKRSSAPSIPFDNRLETRASP